MATSWLPGRSTITFHHSPTTTVLKERNKESHALSLSQICRLAVPPTCQLNPFLFNGHLQTAWTLTKDETVPIYYKRVTFEAEDTAYAGSFTVDFVVEPFVDGEEEKKKKKKKKKDEGDKLPPRTAHATTADEGADGDADGLAPSDDRTPMLIALHGLSGGSHELYLRHVLAPLLGRARDGEGGGWKACVVNARGCAGSPVTSRMLFNARATWDVRQVVRWLRRRWPNRPLFAVGFSLGANILVNYVGEEGAECLLSAAVVCSNPWNLDVSSVALQRTWLGREVYSRTMASNLKALVEIHKDQVSKNREVSLERIRKTRYLYEFDREIQCPTWGYPTVGAYYRDASSVDSLLAVRIPLFALNAEDDPIAVKEALPIDEFRRNPYTVLCTTSRGGHLAWFESGGGRWFVKPITSFLRQMAVASENTAPGYSLSCMPKGEALPEADMAPFHPVRRKMSIVGNLVDADMNAWHDF